MPRKVTLLPALVVLLFCGVAAYWLMQRPATVDSAIQPYLKGEMAKLSIPAESGPITDYSFISEAGAPVALSDYKGRVVLLNLWASWCAPCRKEMPELANLQTLIGDELFEVVAVSVDRGGIAQARETLAEWGVEGLALYADPTMKIAMGLASGALPTSVIIGKDGAVKASYLGPLRWDAPEAIALFQFLKDRD